MTALERAVALAEVDARAVCVEQDLDLDVARALDEALEDEAIVAEGRLGLRRAAARPPEAGRGRAPCACPCRHLRRLA